MDSADPEQSIPELVQSLLRNHTKAELARKVGVSARNIDRWIKEQRTPTDQNLIALREVQKATAIPLHERLSQCEDRIADLEETVRQLAAETAELHDQRTTPHGSDEPPGPPGAYGRDVREHLPSRREQPKPRKDAGAGKRRGTVG